MRNAIRLVHTRGDGALDYALRMAETMRDTGDAKDIEFWEKISRQVELLLEEQNG